MTTSPLPDLIEPAMWTRDRDDITDFTGLLHDDDRPGCTLERLEIATLEWADVFTRSTLTR